MTRGLLHDSLVYSSEDELAAVLVPFLRDGFESGDVAVVVTTPSNTAVLRDALGADAAGATFVPSASWYSRPARTIAGYHETLAKHLAMGARGVRVVGEVEFGSTDRERADWTVYESMLNRVFAGVPAWIVCPYDTRALPEQVLQDAQRTHPRELRLGSPSVNDRFEDPQEFVGRFAAPAITLPATPPVMAAARVDLRSARGLVASSARLAGFDEHTTDELTVAVNEIVANSLAHAGDAPDIRIWIQDGPEWVAEISDRGSGFDDPFAGYVPPATGSEGGMGLWLARQFTDRLDWSLEDGCFHVRMTRTGPPGRNGSPRAVDAALAGTPDPARG